MVSEATAALKRWLKPLVLLPGQRCPTGATCEPCKPTFVEALVLRQVVCFGAVIPVEGIALGVVHATEQCCGPLLSLSPVKLLHHLPRSITELSLEAHLVDACGRVGIRLLSFSYTMRSIPNVRGGESLCVHLPVCAGHGRQRKGLAGVLAITKAGSSPVEAAHGPLRHVVEAPHDVASSTAEAAEAAKAAESVAAMAAIAKVEAKACEGVAIAEEAHGTCEGSHRAMTGWHRLPST
mmetsp:Transcript_16098/g.35355  ORF Transcript_16098/g.35355 Transcript_16098/m.35355 type:complete len:237 (+) Transcript_16098:193-903(+)|eukprot:CAMPEP_0170614000 /NCGR_PEP_ID=MMETSP0224-20130122/24569_1 /TAXON_ID=285029 /ORGANISM="Togula jolla, Strain CCCM 725" /LENGTH=236 /DNA_ID=CAMNT_0010939633 /DNA_START=136 /DNA_END=846 /DNA_ORIENTATION=+